MTRRLPKQQRRRVGKTVTLDWVPVLADVFDLPTRLGMTPPAQVVVVISPDGRRWSWHGAFTTAEGVPAKSVVRMRKLKNGDFSADRGNVAFKFVLAGARPEAADA